MKLPTLALCVVGAALATAAPRQDRPRRPVDVFAAWDGEWRGTFVGYDPTGKELYRIAVHQRYRTIDAHTQEVTIRDTMPDGKVIEGRGKNVASRQKDGSVALTCTVEKSNGDRVVHRGRVVRGPGGREELMWYSVQDDRTETFREWVDGPRYFIHGMGRYGGSMMLMAGEYHRPQQRQAK